jgi:hypothetical protein
MPVRRHSSRVLLCKPAFVHADVLHTCCWRDGSMMAASLLAFLVLCGIQMCLYYTWHVHTLPTGCSHAAQGSCGSKIRMYWCSKHACWCTCCSLFYGFTVAARFNARSVSRLQESNLFLGCGPESCCYALLCCCMLLAVQVGCECGTCRLHMWAAHEVCTQYVPVCQACCDASGDVIATGNVALRTSTLQYCCLC